ncbi:MAG: AI-2E family transporter [Marinibacterium sp.]
MKGVPLLNLVLITVLVLAVGYILIAGRAILVPIVTAVISVYVLNSAASGLQRLPVFRYLPVIALRSLILMLFALTVFGLAITVAATVREISSVAPSYEANIDAMLERVAAIFHLDRQALWTEIKAVSIDRFDLGAAVVAVLGGFRSVGTSVFLIVLYAAFLMVEQEAFARKLAKAIADPDKARRTLDILADINQRISDYLVIKTVFNMVLGTASFVVLHLMGVDFALFWAVVIGLLNYIPYVGSYIGVAFPVLLSLAQFGSFPKTLALAAMLGVVQFILGSVIEPRVLGRQLNLSPIVVLIALSVWTTIWGVPGAILAVPMTAILAIALASFSTTRPVAVLLADRIEAGHGDRVSKAG